jgi:sugar/nucleoside kinase (ribokinase family)
MLDVLSVSDMCVDLVIRGNVRPQFHQVEQLVEDYSLEMGGSANIFASQFAKLGGKSGLVGFVGQDGLGTFLLDKLQHIGVDTSQVQIHPSLKTGISAILAEPSDRAILTYLGTIDAVTPPGLGEGFLTQCRHWHIASYFLLGQLRGYWRKWLAECQEAGITVSLDTNWDPENRWEGVRELLPLVDVFLPNEAEALGITGEREVRTAAEKLSALGPLVAVKCGEKGSIACHRGEAWEGPLEKPGRIVDAVGAGDNFDAGFVYSWMRGKSIPEALALGTRCAVSSLGAAGGIEGQLLSVD